MPTQPAKYIIPQLPDKMVWWNTQLEMDPQNSLERSKARSSLKCSTSSQLIQLIFKRVLLCARCSTMRQLKGDCGTQSTVSLIPKQYFMPVYIREHLLWIPLTWKEWGKLPESQLCLFSQATLSSLGVKKAVALRTRSGPFVVAEFHPL